jgi:flagellar basal body L-ring protein FlgH
LQIDYLQDNKRLLLSELVKVMQSKWQAFKKWLANGGQNNLYKIKKPLKINRLTTVIVLKAGLEPARPLLTTGF